jgi:hypothetical protein
MSIIKYSKQFSALIVFVLMAAPTVSFSRDNSLTGGISVGFDYSDRSGEGADEEDDSQQFVLSPMINFISLSERDSFELLAAPGLKYDVEDSETDWDATLNVEADRFMTRTWQLGVSNRFIRSDYHDTVTRSIEDPADPLLEEIVLPADPQLSTDRGRRQYWRNTVGLFSNHFYREDSLIGLNANYIVLRNDDTGFAGDEDYDRYTVGLRNEHRYNAKWKSILGLRYVVGDYDDSDSFAGTPTDEELSDDVKEYYLDTAIENNSIANNPLSLSYNYIATRFDEDLQDDSDIHQMRVTWRRDFSSRMYTRLGIGPTYEKTEGQSANWSENGIAEVNYAFQHGYINFLVEKISDVDNFSGSDERGAVDRWESRLAGSYQLKKDIALSGRLSYINEDREESGGDFQRDRYIAGTKLSYTFWQYYAASIDYTFTKQDSDRERDEYDDHRVLLTLSWKKELFRW